MRITRQLDNVVLSEPNNKFVFPLNALLLPVGKSRISFVCCFVIWSFGRLVSSIVVWLRVAVRTNKKLNNQKNQTTK